MPDPKAPVWGTFLGFLEALEKTGASIRIKKRCHDWESKGRKNLERVLAVSKELFRRHSKILVIRLDLHCKSGMSSGFDGVRRASDFFNDLKISSSMRYANGGVDFNISSSCDEKSSGARASRDSLNQLGGPKGIELKTSFEEVQRLRGKFFSRMKGKPSLFRHLVGHVWRIEATPIAGYHIHLVLFFNGHHVQNDVYYGMAIGDYWANEVADGNGYYRNVNADWRGDEKTYGIGMVEASDERKRENLVRHVMGYLCKTEQAVLTLPYAGCNTFGAGFTHRDRAKGRGRPRTKGAEPQSLGAGVRYP